MESNNQFATEYTDNFSHNNLAATPSKINYDSIAEEEDPYENAIKQRWSKKRDLDYSPYKPGGIFHNGQQHYAS